MSTSTFDSTTSKIGTKAHLKFENGDSGEIHEDLKHLFKDDMFGDVILEDHEPIIINTTYLKNPANPLTSVDEILSSSSVEYIDEKVKDCFPIGSVWEDRDMLRTSLTKAMAKTQCLLSLNHSSQLQCKNCKQDKGCSFEINFVAICKTKRGNKRNRTPLWQHPVSISSACFKHTCSRTTTTFKAAIKRSGIEQKVVDEQLNQLIINLYHTTPSLPTKVLRPILETFCPPTIIWDADKLRDFRTSFFNKVASLSEEDHSNIEKFRENFISLDYNELLTSSATFADSTTFNSKVLCKMFLKEYEGGLEHGCSDMNLIDNTVEGYLKFCYSHDDTFDYRILKDANGIIVAVAWMTGAMRDAFDRYGTIVFFDGCHKKLNTSLYPYFGILVKDTNHCILPAIEGLGIGEEDRVIIFLFSSMINMAHERKQEDIKVVSSDGILDQSYVNLKLNLPQAYYWADTWHIIERNFGNKKNIPMVTFNKIRNDLWNMAKATSRDKFESYYNAILEEFKAASVSSEVIKYFVDTVCTKRKHFASYYADSVEGLFGFNGSQANESKHSTFTAYFQDNYCHPPYRLICDLLFLGRVCQGKITRNLNSDNSKLRLMKEKSTTSKKPMHAAVTTAIGMRTNESLNYQGFLLWMNEFNAASDRCSIIKTSDDNHDVIVVYDSVSREEYSFTSIKAHCPGCKVSCAFVMQCRHEICVRLKSKLPPEEVFEIARCDKRWYFQEDITILARNDSSLDTCRTNSRYNTELDQNLTGYDILTQTSPIEEDENTTSATDTINTSSLIDSLSMKKMKTPTYKRYHLDEIDHYDVERITTQFQKKLSMCGNNNTKKKALSMLLSIIESCDKEGMTDDSLDNAWRNYCGDSRRLTLDPNNSDPLPASRSAMNAARYNSNTLTTQESMRKKLKKSNASSQSGMSSRKIISSSLGNACGFCNQTKCSIKTCSLKESYGTAVTNADDFFERICKEYPIGKTPMKIQFSESDKFFTTRQSCHIIVHSIHPRNELLEETNPPSKKEDLVLQITCLHKKKDKFTTKCGLPIDGFVKVTVPCSLMYHAVVQIVSNKTSNRYVFDKVAMDGTGPGFLPRTTTHPTTTSTLTSLPYTSNVNPFPPMIAPQPFMMPPAPIFHPWFNAMPPYNNPKKNS